MKKATEKSAVRWSCAILGVLFFFCAACAWTFLNLQLNYGCAADDTAAQSAIISDLYDRTVEQLSQALVTYFENGRSWNDDDLEAFQKDQTNFRYRVPGTDLNTLNDEEVRFVETKQTVVTFSAGEDGSEQNETLSVECAVSDPLEVNDVYRRTLTLMEVGASMENVFRIACIVFLALTLLFCVPALRSVLREAKRRKGASRLFNTLPPDLYVCCVLPALVYFAVIMMDKAREKQMLEAYLDNGSAEYRFLLRPGCLTGLFALLLVLLMLLVFSLRRGGIRYLFTFSRFRQAPFPRRMLFYLAVMQSVKCLAIALYLNAYTRWVVMFLLLEKLVTLPVVYQMLRQMRDVMDQTAQFVHGDLSGRASRADDFATVRAHGADIDSMVRRISDSADEYVKSSRFKAELITNLSHDIKTPLTSIISYAQLLDSDDLPQDTRKEYLAVLQRHSDRLQKLVEDLTEVSDAASGNMPVQLTVLDLSSLVSASALAFEERLQNRKITIRYYVPEEPVFVTADPRLLQRVTDNLMNNICKYAREDSEVQIAVVDGKSSVAAVFRNRSAQPFTLSGDALMERFVREDGARHSDGSGLGLSIAQSLMQIQNGKLWLHTEDDVFTAQILFRKS